LRAEIGRGLLKSNNSKEQKVFLLGEKSRFDGK
jgi:hypothetical protein